MYTARSLFNLHRCVGVGCLKNFSGGLPWSPTVKKLEYPSLLSRSSESPSMGQKFPWSVTSRLMSTNTLQYEHLIVSVKHGVRTISFNRPDKKNAINEKMFDEIVAALQEAANDPETIITATTGVGNVYCAGNDKNNFTDITMTEIRDLLTRHMAAFIDFPKPLVAVVNGAAVGVGSTLLPLYDAVFATEKAVFFTPFSALSLTAEGCSSFTYHRLMGRGKAAGMLLFNEKVTATEACKCGLVTEVFPDATFQDEVWARLDAMARLPIKSLMYSKALIRDLYKDVLHRVNIEECKRVTECFGRLADPEKKEYQEFIRTNWQ